MLALVNDVVSSSARHWCQYYQIQWRAVVLYFLWAPVIVVVLYLVV